MEIAAHFSMLCCSSSVAAIDIWLCSFLVQAVSGVALGMTNLMTHLHGNRLPDAKLLCLLAGIEEIGVSIEEPFSILALEFMCDTLQRNVAELQAMTSGAGGQGSNGNGRPAVSAAQLVSIAKAQAAAVEAAAGDEGVLGTAAAGAGANGNGNGNGLA